MHPLRDYQIEAIENIRTQFKKGKRKILLVAPTGSGKTVIASEIMKRAEENGKKTLFVAHRRELIMQCSRKLNDFGVNHGVIMAGKSPFEFANVQVASIQTFTRRKDRDDFTKPDADLLILDEAHRSVSNSFQDLVNEYPNAFTIGLTATPVRSSDGKGLGDIYEEIVETSSVKELISQGYLVPNRVVAPTMPDLKGIKTIAGDYDKQGLEKRMNVPKLVGDIVSHWLKYASDRPTVVFASSIKHSQYISNIFNQNGIPAGHIDGEMNEVDREEQLDLLNQGKIKVLSNCMVLTEGWDQPKISCVILARPTKSYSLYLQMVGRTFRPYPDKKDTLIIDHSGAVYQHNFPEDTPLWKLTTSKVFNDKKKEIKPIEKQLYTCVECQTIYKLTRDEPHCPNCNHLPTRKEQILLVKQGRLIEVPKKKPGSIDKKRFYAELLYYSRQKGYKDGWASWIFKEKYKHFPHSKKINPIAIGEEVLQFIKHHNIKQAKSRNRQKNGVHRANISDSERQSRGIVHGKYEEIRL